VSESLPFGKDAKPEYPEKAARAPLTKFQFATLFLRQGGCCARCGQELEAGKVRDEHLTALALSGGNELTNRALWCIACVKPKDAADKKLIAKSARIRGEHGQRARREKNGPSLKSGRQLQGRGFQTRLTKGFDGKIRERT
jgi:hypothetical protein